LEHSSWERYIYQENGIQKAQKTNVLRLKSTVSKNKNLGKMREKKRYYFIGL